MNSKKPRNFNITNSTLKDRDEILNLYASAVKLQKEKNAVPWGEIPENQIEREINMSRQFKLILEGQIAVVWLYTFSDKQIWKEKDIGNALYIHRIATNPRFRGRNLVNEVLTFSENYAKKCNLQFIRLDTAGYNEGLINHYTGNGFRYLGTTRIEDTKNLPSHYKNVDICLFEKKIKYRFVDFFSIVIEGAEGMAKLR